MKIKLKIWYKKIKKFNKNMKNQKITKVKQKLGLNKNFKRNMI